MAKDKAASAAAAAQDDPELRGLEAAYLRKTFTEPAKKTGNGKAKEKDPERFIVQAIVWSAEHKAWHAECVQLDARGNIPPSSKTAMGTVLRGAIFYYLPHGLDAMLD